MKGERSEEKRAREKERQEIQKNRMDVMRKVSGGGRKN